MTSKLERDIEKLERLTERATELVKAERVMESRQRKRASGYRVGYVDQTAEGFEALRRLVDRYGVLELRRRLRVSLPTLDQALVRFRSDDGEWRFNRVSLRLIDAVSALDEPAHTIDDVIALLPARNRQRIVNGLARKGIDSLEKLTATTAYELGLIPNMGMVCIKNIADALVTIGRKLQFDLRKFPATWIARLAKLKPVD